MPAAIGQNVVPYKLGTEKGSARFCNGVEFAGARQKDRRSLAGSGNSMASQSDNAIASPRLRLRETAKEAARDQKLLLAQGNPPHFHGANALFACVCSYPFFLLTSNLYFERPRCVGRLLFF